MAYENILYEKKDGIAYITFNRPKVLNALNNKTIDELRQALVDARDDGAVRVLILTGAGEKAFVAGADISELAQRTPVDEAKKHLLQEPTSANWPSALRLTEKNFQFPASALHTSLKRWANLRFARLMDLHLAGGASWPFVARFALRAGRQNSGSRR